MKSNKIYSMPGLFTKDYTLLLIAGLLGFTSIGIFYLFPLFITHLGGSKSDIGTFMGIMSLSAVAVRPWVSGLVDRIGRKPSFYMGCLLLTAVSVSHTFFMRDIDSVFYLFILLRLIYGVGLSFMVVTTLTLTMDLVPKERLNEGIGIFGVMPLLGIAIGPLIGEYIVDGFGFLGMFNSAVMVNVAALIFMLPIKEPFQSHTTLAGGGFFTVLRSPIIWRIGVIILGFGVAFAAHGGFVAPFAKSKALSVSLYFATYSAAAILSRLFGGRLTAHFGEKRIIPVSMIIIGVGFFWLVQVKTNWGLAVTGILAGAGHGTFFPSVLAFAVRSTEPGDRGKVTGVLTGSVDAGMLIGSFALGHLGDLFGFQVLFFMAAMFVVFGAVLFFFMRGTLSKRIE